MFFKLIVPKPADHDTLQHYLVCAVHRQALIDRLVVLMEQAAAFEPPCTVSMLVGEVGEEDVEGAPC
jgi:hypothetical protein